MKHKLLPLPIGEPAPRGSSIRFWQQYRFRFQLDSATLVAGLLLAVAGAWIGLHPSPVVVGVDDAGYHLDGTVLKRVGAESFNGGTAIVFQNSGGELRAAAAGRLGQRDMQGVCSYFAGAATEECVFVVGGFRFRAHDKIAAGAWQRRYEDGRTIELKLADPRRPIPVPVPVGWQ